MGRLGKSPGLTGLWWLMLFVVSATEVWARPGGGSSFSSGSSGSSGGGGGGDGLDIEALFYLLQFVIKYPQFGLPLLAMIAFFYFINSGRSPAEEIVSSSLGRGEWARRGSPLRQQVRELIKCDPNFSEVLFVDFASNLFHQYHTWRGQQELRNLAPYFAPALMDQLVNRQKTSERPDLEVAEIVIGTAGLVRLGEQDWFHTAGVRFHSNYTETSGHDSRRCVAVDEWNFRRNKGALSKEPAEMQNLGCPNCGAKLELKPTGECLYCGTRVGPGKLQWELYSVVRVSFEVERGQKFGAYTEEAGTGLATLLDPDLDGEFAVFCQRHGGESRAKFTARFQERIVIPFMKAIYESWESRDWEKARPLMTDHLFNSHCYWITSHKQNRLINHLRDFQIRKVTVVKLITDKFFESLTVRIEASVIDYLEHEATGKIDGDSDKPREFSEYWTFIRRAGVEKWEDEQDLSRCPNCGAPMKIGMVGVCLHCSAKVVTGEFGWILAAITQDEVYSG